MSNWFTGKIGAQPDPQGGVPLRPVQPVYQPQPVQSTVYQQRPAQPPQGGVEHNQKQGKVDVNELFTRTDLQGPAAKMEGHLSCPSCGSRTAYTEYSQMMGQMRPAPHCYECGFNGKFAQGEAGGAWVQ